MMERAQILSLVIDAASELNQSLASPIALSEGESAVLYGHQGVLDSLELVNFILLVEERILDATGAPITLAEDRAMSQFRSPFRSVGSVTDYIQTLAA
jgi:acyl carrier protein